MEAAEKLSTYYRCRMCKELLMIVYVDKPDKYWSCNTIVSAYCPNCKRKYKNTDVLPKKRKKQAYIDNKYREILMERDGLKKVRHEQ